MYVCVRVHVCVYVFKYITQLVFQETAHSELKMLPESYEYSAQ
jgi:hypothetical protein